MQRKCLLFISSNIGKLSNICAALEANHACIELTLEKFMQGAAPSVDGIIIDIDLKNTTAVDMMKKGLENFDRSKTFLAVIIDKSRASDALEAIAMGADTTISRSHYLPSDAEDTQRKPTAFADKISLEVALRKINQLIQSYSTRQNQPEMLRQAIKTGDKAISKVFDFGRTGKAPTKEELKQDSREIIDALYEHGLDAWLNIVRAHHDATYQHCLIVSGVATAFGQAIGCNDKDLERISVGAMLHDIGKSQIPLEVLQKTGPLDPAEWMVMKQHPELGRNIMSAVESCDPEIIDIIAHHHEYLDGSGYPDQLSGSEVSDIVRIMTISDIFGAMIERRSYKKEMSSIEAYEILTSMTTKLEMPLVRAFKDVVKSFQTAA